MPRFHAYTIRNGHYLCGNVGHVSAIWADLKTLRGAINRARRYAKSFAKPGDMICIEQASDGSPYEYFHKAKFFFYG